MKPVELTIEDYSELVKEFHKESDRAAAVIAGSFIENYVATFLQSFMIGDRKLVDELFDGLGPFANYKSRIKTLRALNFIDKKLYTDLKTIADIRNEFAHHPKSLSFESEIILRLVKKLSTKNIADIDPNNRNAYLLCISMAIAYMHNKTLKSN